MSLHEIFNPENLATVESLAKDHPDLFTKAQLKWMLRIRHRNGLRDSGAVIKVSKKLYFIKPKFFNWLSAQTV